MTDFLSAEIRQLPLNFPPALREADALLKRCALRRAPLDYFAGLYIDDELCACGGYRGHTIECVAVAPEHRGEGCTNTLLSHLLELLLSGGASNVTVFTKPGNEDIFQSIGFHTIVKTSDVLLLEDGYPGIRAYLDELSEHRRDGVSGACVMNCNPFTLGHRYLVEKAASMCDTLHLFVVEEDLSVFPFEVRFELVRKGTADIENVVLHRGGDYIVSSATFPSYFLKEYTSATAAHAELDVTIFAQRIAPVLGITRRFVGEEPLDAVTAEYNSAMKKTLPLHGIEPPVIIKRLERDGKVISASAVRALLASGDMDGAFRLVPETTGEFLRSERAKPVIEKIKKCNIQKK